MTEILRDLRDLLLYLTVTQPFAVSTAVLLVVVALLVRRRRGR